ncbi:IS701 family transposase [Streptomyces sp. NPDC056528]|uniref:IS701 family transposase n=1 Tax=Streptomyces sp. NPDC056528 TaxID=3345854 RepID=UPI0036A63DB9
MSFDEGVTVRGVTGARVRLADAGLGDRREAVTREIADRLFASLTRRDQRKKGEQYLRGLLSTPGRKSIRNVAAHVGGPAAEQSLHHFISSSTWDWKPVREALALYLSRVDPPRAWVVHPMPIPKEGEHSVGVDQGYDPCLGAFRGQRALGVWHASETLSTPVDWRLLLPGSWTRDEARRRRAEIPQDAGEETLEECAATAVLDVLGSWRVPRRPVVLNSHVGHVARTVSRFTRAGVPVVARVGATARLTVQDPAMPGHDEGPLAAQEIFAGVRRLRRGVELVAPPTGADTRATLAAAVRVGVRGGAEDPGDLVLLGEWGGKRTSADALWVTNMTSVSAGALIRMTKLGGRACQDLSAAGEDVGLKDFEGRSFRGWHRHMTLASAAHAVAALSGSGREAVASYASRSA